MGLQNFAAKLYNLGTNDQLEIAGELQNSLYQTSKKKIVYIDGNGVVHRAINALAEIFQRLYLTCVILSKGNRSPEDDSVEQYLVHSLKKLYLLFAYNEADVYNQLDNYMHIVSQMLVTLQIDPNKLYYMYGDIENVRKLADELADKLANELADKKLVDDLIDNTIAQVLWDYINILNTSNDFTGIKFVVVMDGIPPMAKVMEQKHRSMGSVIDAAVLQHLKPTTMDEMDEYEHDCFKKYVAFTKNMVFSRECIKYGSDLFHRMSEQGWWTKLTGGYIDIEGVAWPEGEGEQTIMDSILKSHDTDNLIISTDSDCVVLMMQNLETVAKQNSTVRVILYRENFNDAVLVTQESVLNVFQNIDLEPKYKRIKDLCFLFHLLGHDFIQPLGAHTRSNVQLFGTDIIEFYRSYMNRNPTSFIIQDDKSIAWAELQQFLRDTAIQNGYVRKEKDQGKIEFENPHLAHLKNYKSFHTYMLNKVKLDAFVDPFHTVYKSRMEDTANINHALMLKYCQGLYYVAQGLNDREATYPLWYYPYAYGPSKDELVTFLGQIDLTKFNGILSQMMAKYTLPHKLDVMNWLVFTSSKHSCDKLEKHFSKYMDEWCNKHNVSKRYLCTLIDEYIESQQINLNIAPGTIMGLPNKLQAVVDCTNKVYFNKCHPKKGGKMSFEYFVQNHWLGNEEKPQINTHANPQYWKQLLDKFKTDVVERLNKKIVSSFQYNVNATSFMPTNTNLQKSTEAP